MELKLKLANGRQTYVTVKDVTDKSVESAIHEVEERFRSSVVSIDDHSVQEHSLGGFLVGAVAGGYFAHLIMDKGAKKPVKETATNVRKIASKAKTVAKKAVASTQKKKTKATSSSTSKDGEKEKSSITGKSDLTKRVKPNAKGVLYISNGLIRSIDLKNGKRIMNKDIVDGAHLKSKSGVPENNGYSKKAKFLNEDKNLSDQTNYVSKNRIKSVNTTYGKVFHEEDLIDGAYIKDSVKFEKGGSTDTTIARTILQQLGGSNRLSAMTGASNFVAGPNFLSFKLKSPKINHIKITLNAKDLYDIQFSKIHGFNFRVVKSVEDVYDDMLVKMIEKETGMYLKFEEGGTTDQSDKEWQALKERILPFLKETYPNNKTSKLEELSDEDYNDIFFEMVDEVRKKFPETADDDSANTIVEQYMDNDQYRSGGALRNDRNHVNHSEDYEVRYSKDKPHRRGYRGMRKFEEGGGLSSKVTLVGIIENIDTESKTFNIHIPSIKHGRVTYKVDYSKASTVPVLKEGDQHVNVEGRFNGETLFANHILRSSFAEGGNVDTSSATAKAQSEIQLLKEKGFEITDFSEENGSDLVFGDANDFIIATQGEKDGTHSIAYNYQNEDSGLMVLDKNILNIISESFKGSTVTLFTNAGVDIHSSANGKYKNITVEKVKFPAVEEFRSGGALRNDRNHVNHSEDYEVRYSKDKPHRVGYRGTRKFEVGGKIYEYPATGDLYFSYDFENKGNTWNVLIKWHPTENRRTYLSILKKTNNPHGGRMGKEFSTVEEAVDNYKDMNIKAQIIFAAKEAEKHGYVAKYQTGGSLSSSREEKMQKINAFLDLFPNDADSWADATDEIPDLHNTLAEYFPKYKGNIYVSEGGTLPNNILRSPSRRNTIHKKAIETLLSKMKDNDFNEFYENYIDWFEPEDDSEISHTSNLYAKGGNVGGDYNYEVGIMWESNNPFKSGIKRIKVSADSEVSALEKAVSIFSLDRSNSNVEIINASVFKKDTEQKVALFPPSVQGEELINRLKAILEDSSSKKWMKEEAKRQLAELNVEEFAEGGSIMSSSRYESRDISNYEFPVGGQDTYKTTTYKGFGVFDKWLGHFINVDALSADVPFVFSTKEQAEELINKLNHEKVTDHVYTVASRPFDASLIGAKLLKPLDKEPLDTQLKKLTGYSWSSGVWVDENGDPAKALAGTIIINKDTDQHIMLPSKYYDYIDGFNMFIEPYSETVRVYPQNYMVAKIKDNTLVFDHMDAAISVDRMKIIDAFKRNVIPAVSYWQIGRYRGYGAEPSTFDPDNKFVVGDVVAVKTGYGEDVGTVKADYSDESFYVGHQNGYEVSGFGDRIKPEQMRLLFRKSETNK